MGLHSKPIFFDSPIYVSRPLLPDLNLFKSLLAEIWDSKILSNNGIQIQKLERNLKNFLKVPDLSIFNNGTMALISAIKCLDLKGEVLTTPFTFPATSNALSFCGIEPVFCDIEPSSMTISPSSIRSRITDQTTAILGVHVYGIPCDVEAIKQISIEYGLKVIYDGAHAFGTEIDNVSIGNFGDMTMFSFHPTKLFHTGEGGAISFQNKALREKLQLIKNFGIKDETTVVLPGVNGKMNEISAALGQLVLDMVQFETKKRSVLRDIYKSNLSGIAGLDIVEVPYNVKNSEQYFVIRINKTEFGEHRDDVYNRLRKSNVYARKYFYPLLSDYPFYTSFNLSINERFPNARIVSEEVLSLPFYGDLTEEQVEKICKIIKSN